MRLRSVDQSNMRPPLTSSELILNVIARCQDHPTLAWLPPIVRIHTIKMVVPKIFLLSACLASSYRFMPVFMFVENKIKYLKDQILLLGLTREEIIFVESSIITKSVPILKTCLHQPPALISPLRTVSLMMIINTILEVDLNKIINNFFGGNNQLVNVLLEKNILYIK